MAFYFDLGYKGFWYAIFLSMIFNSVINLGYIYHIHVQSKGFNFKLISKEFKKEKLSGKYK
jgi:Na+-driven multidrug efflux pump